MKRLLATLLLSAAVAVPQVAHAWGATGHRLVGQVATESLPSDLPAFLRKSGVAEDVGELVREPDRWKGMGEPHHSMREGYHFVDVDDAGRILGGPALDALPATMKEYEAALAAAGTDRFKAGWLPYALVDSHKTLTVYFGLWRAARAGERTAKTRAERAWFKRDRQRREALILREIGVYGHWIGDASQPHHTSIHFNGWDKDAPNPNGYTRERVHSRFEGDFVRDNTGLAEVRAAMRPGPVCAEPIQTCAVRLIRETNDRVVPFYELEKAGAFAAGDPRGRAFAVERLAAGASWMRDLVSLAWRDSASIKVGWSPIEVRAVEAGEVDPYVSLRGRD